MSSRLLLDSLSPVGGSILTNGVVVAVVALVHIQIATFLTGSSTLAVVSEAISMARKDERQGRLAHMLVTSQTYVFSFGSAIAILFILFVLTGLWAILWTALQQVAFWVLVFEGAMFLSEIVLLYTLYVNWDRLRDHRPTRLALMVLLNISLWWQMFLIDVVASFMLTPNGGDTSLLNQVLNPTDLPLTIHRTIGNIAWAGAVVAVIGAVNYLRLTRHSREPQPDTPATLRPLHSIGAMAAGHLEAETRRAEILHWEWVTQWGVIWAVALSLMQPWVGYSYAKEIQLHAYGAWYALMFGDLSNVFLVQIFLLGMIFILAALFFWRRMVRSGAPHARRQLFLMIALVLMLLLAVQPAWFSGSYADAIAAAGNRPWWQGGLLNPVGNFIPFKAAALIGMVIFGLWSVTAYATALSRGHIRPGGSGRGAQRAALILGVTVSLMMMVMGVLREHSRQPYLVYGEITIHQQLTNTNPSTPAVGPGQPVRVAPGAVALRIPIFHSAHEELRTAIEPPWPQWMRDLYKLDRAQDEGIDVEAEQTTVPAALGALGSRLRHRLELISSIAGGLQRQGWHLHIDGDSLFASRVANPQHALELLEGAGLAGPLCAVADLDDTGWPKLYEGAGSPV